MGGREASSLAAEIEGMYGVRVEGVDRERLPGCQRRVLITRRFGGGDVAGAAVELYQQIQDLAGSQLRFPAISW